MTIFLSMEDVLQIHADAITHEGGDQGVRDLGLLESALAQPPAQYFGEAIHPDLACQAAAYAFHLTSNHAFVDGNRRVGFASVCVFLKANRAKNVDYFGLAKLILSIAEGVKSKQDAIDWFHAQGL
ncbi:MAG: type II toxin-antitoxin system death-on-curing family toxin [Deltaproteobacteria bacterium]|nr:type II toxin-antitoxin system death-on-curing family toxin [Deltaproteobacteria bacterium]